MKITKLIVGGLSALLFTAVNAMAVTVNITHTGSVFYVDVGDGTGIFTPDPNRSINLGDTGTFSYTLDLDQTPGTPGPSVTGSTDMSINTWVDYVSGPATFTLSGGPSFDLGPLRFQVFSTVNQNSNPDPYSQLVTAQSTQAEGPFAGFDYRFPSRTDPYSTDLKDVLTSSMPFNQDPSQLQWGSGLYLHTTPDSLGIAPMGCLSGPSTDPGSKCIAEFNFVSTVLTLNGLPYVPAATTPTTPSVTPVPLPAPLAMLGIAMLGLLGFGKRKSAS